MKPLAVYCNNIAGLLSGVFLFIIFVPSLQNIIQAWTREEYSHGYFIPFIAVFLAWHRLAEVRPVLRPSWWGLVWVAAAGGMQLVARLSAFDTIAQYGLIVALAGLSVAFWGRQATRTIAPALFYLIFAIPLPHLMQANLSAQLQLLSSTLGVWPLDLFGIPVYQEGNIIDLGGYKLQVVEACSGLRYLFPLMSFGYLMAFLIKDRMWKRVVLFLSTIPITIGMNSLRIAFIGVTVDLWGRAMAEGFLHIFEGWTVFLVCVAVLAAEAWILMRIGRRGHFRYEYFGAARGPYFSAAEKLSKTPAFAAFFAVVVLAMLFTSGRIEARTEITPPHPPFASFPLHAGDWHGAQGTIEPNVLDNLQLSDYWIADYKQDDRAAPVNLYIAYYASQRMGSQTHSPSLCIPGGGWHIDDSRRQTLSLADGTQLTVTRILIRKNGQAEIVYYWFDERGRDLTESTVAKWYLLWDSITMHRTDGALVRLVTPIVEDEKETAAENRLNDFLTAVYPTITSFIPGP